MGGYVRKVGLMSNNQLRLRASVGRVPLSPTSKKSSLGGRFRLIGDTPHMLPKLENNPWPDSSIGFCREWRPQFIIHVHVVT